MCVSWRIPHESDPMTDWRQLRGILLLPGIVVPRWIPRLTAWEGLSGFAELK
jgi:hypothetical protein